ncbi:MarR family winged helix-turn-helix transcriptional regulator [Streptomyces sp. NPDC088180]|uniref:MarR family winged helix-turn-helix transcriptional regulator n=1 Tax=Streptomyces sp. NPDC088180 TaxID=3365837 RepID=UPI003828022A
MTPPSGQDSRLNDLERELTLLSRHFIASRGPRIGQSLDRSAYVLLTRMEAGEPLTLKELAHTFQADVSTIHRQVSSMLRHGLVERTAAPTRSGARTFRPTPLGRERLEADRAISRAGAARLIEAAGWSDARTQQFLTLMTEFNHGIERLEELSRDPSARPAGEPPAAK